MESLMEAFHELNKLHESENSFMLTEDLSEDERTKLVELLKQFKDLYAQIKELVSKFPQEQKQQIGSMMGNINFTNITKEDSLDDIKSAIDNIEALLSKTNIKVNRVKQPWEKMVEEAVDDIITDALDATSYSTYPGIDLEEEQRKGLWRCIDIINDRAGLIDIDNQDVEYRRLPYEFRELWEQYAEDNNFDSEEEGCFTYYGDEFREKVNSEFKKQYEYLIDNYNMIDDENMKKLYKEILLDGWKESHLPY